MAEIIYKELCYYLYGIFYNIQNNVGSIYSEKQYQDILEIKLKSAGITYEREKDLFFEVGNDKIGGNKADFVIDNKIVVDTKTKEYITKEDFRQMLRYLKAGQYKLGLIVNFRGKKVQIKRVVNSCVKYLR